MLEFLRIFISIAFFKIVRDFLNSSVAHAKIVKCTLFYLNTVGQTQQSLLSPF